ARVCRGNRRDRRDAPPRPRRTRARARRAAAGWAAWHSQRPGARGPRARPARRCRAEGERRPDAPGAAGSGNPRAWRGPDGGALPAAARHQRFADRARARRDRQGARIEPDIELVRGLVAIPSTSRREGEAVEWLAAPDWCVIGEPSGWDAVTVAYKGRLALRVALSRPARHGAAPGLTCSEEALALWSRLRASAEKRTKEAEGFAKLDCRLEGMSGGTSDGLVERAELRVGYRNPPGITTAELEADLRAIAAAHDGAATIEIGRAHV